MLQQYLLLFLSHRGFGLRAAQSRCPDVAVEQAMAVVRPLLVKSCQAPTSATWPITPHHMFMTHTASGFFFRTSFALKYYSLIYICKSLKVPV